MKPALLILMLHSITGCSVRPDNTVSYAARIPNRDIKVIYDQRMPHLFGGEEDVSVELADARKIRISINGRFSESLHASISSDGSWYRFYLKGAHARVGHLDYRDCDNDGELDRYWISESENPRQARSHPYAILAFFDTSCGRVYRDNKDFGFRTTQARDYFGCKTSLPGRQWLFGRQIVWEPMKRINDEKEASKPWVATRDRFVR